MPLIADIEAFLTAHPELKPTVFAKLASGDPSFVLTLRGGREPRPETAERVKSFMEKWRAGDQAGVVQVVEASLERHRERLDAIEERRRREVRAQIAALLPKKRPARRTKAKA